MLTDQDATVLGFYLSGGLFIALATADIWFFALYPLQKNILIGRSKSMDKHILEYLGQNLNNKDQDFLYDMMYKENGNRSSSTYYKALNIKE